MRERPEDDATREPTMIDPRAAVTEQLGMPAADPAVDPAADPIPDPDATAVVGGRYELRERLGSGGMCDVWRAHDPVLERLVAVKRLLPRWREEERVRDRFAAEALRVAKLSHPAIVGVLDAGSDEQGPFLVMELIEGPSLAARLDELAADHRRMAVEEAVAMGIAVAQGLGAAHRAGIVHRDVKPANILLDPRHGARLTDFGVAKAAADSDMTGTGEVIGTAAYLSPEQALAQPVDARTDVYALGCVLYECLTGARPFAGDSPIATASARIGVQARLGDRVSDVPPGIEQVVTRAMAPQAEDRFPDGDALAAALVAAGGQRRRSGAPLPAPTPAPSAQATQQLPPAAPAPQSTPVPATSPPTRSAGAGSPDGRRVGLVAVVAVLLILAAFAALQALGGEDDPVAGGPEGSEAAGPAAGAPLTGLVATAFDPFGGDGENDDEAALAVDGDPATAWTTVGYNSAAFGNLKPGVGMVIDLGEEVEVTEVRLLGMPAGQSVEVRSAPGAPVDFDATTVVATGRGLDAEAALPLDAATTTRHLVIWLVPDLPSDGGRFRGGFGEVQVFGG